GITPHWRAVERRVLGQRWIVPEAPARVDAEQRHSLGCADGCLDGDIVQLIRCNPVPPGRPAVDDPPLDVEPSVATVAGQSHTVSAPPQFPLPPAEYHNPGLASAPRESTGPLEDQLALFPREDSTWIRCRSRNRTRAARFALPAHAFLSTSMTVNCSNTAGGAVTLW